MYYKMLISWTSQNVKEKHVTHNPFDFKNGMLINLERQKFAFIKKNLNNAVLKFGI